MTDSRVAFSDLWTDSPYSPLINALHGAQNPHVMARLRARREGTPWHFVRESALSIESLLFSALDCIDQRASEACVHFMTRAENAFGLCQSPIEEIFLAACVSIGSDFSRWTEPEAEGATFLWLRENVLCVQQLPVGQFRVDFAFKGKRRVAVEIDGHEFHERSKQQAQRDKARDRGIQEAGWMVLRFTGSEVWSDPAKCVEEVYRIVTKGDSR